MRAHQPLYRRSAYRKLRSSSVRIAVCNRGVVRTAAVRPGGGDLPQATSEQRSSPLQRVAGAIAAGALLALAAGNGRRVHAAPLPAWQQLTATSAASPSSLAPPARQQQQQQAASVGTDASATAAELQGPERAGSSSGSGGGSSSSSSGSGAAAPAQPPAPSQLEGLLPNERAAVTLFASASPSVVNITHVRSASSFLTLDVHRMSVGQGSGFVWDRLGHVVTNYHVIRGASEVKVTLHDHSSCTARVVGVDASKDVAVLKLALPRGRVEALCPVKLSTTPLRVGQSVAAIGNPWGLDSTMSMGIVSGLGRELSSGLTAIKGVIQTDCAINPGNSGGPLLNSAGEVVGVNVGILDPSGKGSFSGVGFAIPVDTVKGLVSQILAHGRVRRPSLGITVAPEQVLAQLGVEGVLVLEVPAGTPAAAAGLRPTYRDVFGDIVLGDVVVGLDTRPVRSTGELLAALDERRAGDRVRVDVLRDGKRLSMTATLGERGMGCE